MTLPGKRSIYGAISNIINFSIILISIAYTEYSSAQDLTLPVYSLTIDSEFLDSLEANPTSDQTYPAILEHDNIIYNCEVRYRGATSIWLPKKSWKICFEDEGINDWEEINLNAEYRDISLCRNFLSMELARIAGLPAPETRFISLLINDEYFGVYLEIEQICKEFYEERDLGEGVIFKAVSHGARFAPPMNSEDLTEFYELKSSAGGNIDTLGARITFLQNAAPEDIALSFDQIVDADNIIAYFATQFCIANHDGFSKNFFLHPDESSRYMLVPWDGDATFGNNWEGNFVDQVDRLSWNALNHQVVFQRLISIPVYHSDLLCKINNLATVGFDSLRQKLSDTYDEIRNDIYFDTLKRGTNEEFEAEFTVLNEWIENRTNYLAGLNYFNRTEILGSEVYPDYLSNPNETVHFEVEMGDIPLEVQVVAFDETNVLTFRSLVDDGTNGDSLANDLIYSLDTSFPDFTSPIYYCFQVKTNSSEGYTTPPSGWYNFSYYPLALPCIQINPEPPLEGEININNFTIEPSTGTHYFSIINTTNRSMDLSGCVVRLGSGPGMLRLPEALSISPVETLFVTNHYDQMTTIKYGANIVGGFYFEPSMGDTLFFETSSGTRLASEQVPAPVQILEALGSVAINEINYNSGEEVDPGDWVELVCREDMVNLSGWVLKDCIDAHSFIIPDGTLLYEGDYLVLAADPSAFTQCFPGITNMIGGFYFGFDGEGEDIRLFDNAGDLIDWVSYDDDEPWPEEPDGHGPTLELINPHQPNYSYMNWRSSSESEPGGTPGQINTVYIYSPPPPVDPSYPQKWELTSVYPNPFNSAVRINFRVPVSGEVTLTIFDLLGRTVNMIKRTVRNPGSYYAIWNGDSEQGEVIGSGIYFIRIDNAPDMTLKKMVLIK